MDKLMKLMAAATLGNKTKNAEYEESMLSLVAVTVLCAGSFSLAAAPAWPDITVEVKADQPVATAQSLTKQADGFQRLAITFSNQGQQPLTIEKITVPIPVPERLTDDLEMLYGGSCMGRTPLLHQNVGTQTKLSSSHMYEMVRLADGQYLFAGSLSWRIFLPNFTLKDGAFVVWSNGEGKQLKPGETIQYEQILLRRAGRPTPGRAWRPALGGSARPTCARKASWATGARSSAGPTA
jgi:alpha-galactosidase